MKQSPPNPHNGFTFPNCPRCQSPMTISRIVPGEPGRETRTFHCPRCGEELSETAPTQR